MKLRYSVIGNPQTTNPPIVFLHGLFGGPRDWIPVANQLANDYMCIVVELPLDLASADMQFDDIHTLTDYTFDVIEHCGLVRNYLNNSTKLILCGNSLGGQVAIDYVLKTSYMIDSLVITGSAGLFERGLSDGNRPKMNKETIRRLAEGVFYNTDHCTDIMVDEVYEMLNTRKALRFLLKIAKATRNTNFSDELHRIDIPTLLVWGKQDVVTPPEVAEEFKQKIKHSQLTYIDKCGHAPQIERPDEFVSAFRKFRENKTC
jgi:pimeloyl-ACP methyl ester carboxylesterase